MTPPPPKKKKIGLFLKHPFGFWTQNKNVLPIYYTVYWKNIYVDHQPDNYLFTSIITYNKFFFKSKIPKASGMPVYAITKQ